ncbi:MAG: sensor histidine kinase [Haloechinothrix sp.]
MDRRTDKVPVLALPRSDGHEDEYGLSRIELVIVSIRFAIVLSAIVVVVIGVDPMRRHPVPAIALLGVALVYAVLLMFRPHWERPGRRSAVLVTMLDSALSLGVIAATGAVESPAATILFLVIVAAATRMRLSVTIAIALALAASYLAIALLVEPERNPFDERMQIGLWWALYLLFTAVLAGSLSLYAERAHEAQAAAKAEAIAEHSAAEEERDLRTRLLAAHQAQHDGLRAILHDFRTPVSSLTALTAELAHPRTTIADAEKEAALRLVSAHAQHFSAMLDALSDVAASRNPTLSGRAPQTVELRELLLVAGDAAGLRPPRLRLIVDPPTARIRIDTQRFRRVLTNLMDNAERHGKNEPVDVVARVDGRLRVDILDRGLGMTPEQLRVATRKDVSLGEAEGGSGLGLWIVEQIVQAMGGELRLDVRPGGGLAAHLSVPLD